ncbi:MAG: response regulator [Acidobacteriaceae bacterium]
MNQLPPLTQSPAQRVLIADDERVIADTLRIILEQNGFQAAAVYSGRDAVERARTWNPHVLLCDVVMPGMDGIEAATKVRVMLPACRVLLFSGQASVLDLLREARERGHEFELLVKPIHPKELLERLRGGA